MYWVRVGDVCTVAENVLCDGEGAEVSVSQLLPPVHLSVTKTPP